MPVSTASLEHSSASSCTIGAMGLVKRPPRTSSNTSRYFIIGSGGTPCSAMTLQPSLKQGQPSRNQVSTKLGEGHCSNLLLSLVVESAATIVLVGEPWGRELLSVHNRVKIPATSGAHFRVSRNMAYTRLFEILGKKSLISMQTTTGFFRCTTALVRGECSLTPPRMLSGRTTR